MSKTHLPSRCHVLTQLWLFYRDEADKHDEWRNFFEQEDIALSLSFAVDNNYVSGVTADGMAVIDDAWNTFCEMINIDPEVEYADIFGAFNASDNPPVDS